MEKILVIPDCHVPYEDPRAFGLMLKAGKLLKPKTIIILGDFGDLMSCSRFDKGPLEAMVQFDYEMEKVNKRLDEVDSLGAKKKKFIAGNHEARLASLLKRQALALYNTLSIPKILKLKERGWDYYEYGQHCRYGKVTYAHDFDCLGPYAHIRAGAIVESSVVHGHTHHAGMNYSGNALGSHHVAIQLGWLGSEKAATYMKPCKIRKNWQHAFGVGYMEPDGTTHLSIVPIIKGVCVVEGKRIS